MSNIDIFNPDYFLAKISDYEKKLKAEKILKSLKTEMQKELKKAENFAERIVIITDTMENISNLLHGRKLKSFSEFRKERKLIGLSIYNGNIKKRKKFKKLKKIKKWKK